MCYAGVAEPRIMPTTTYSFRSPKHRRKQTVKSEKEMDRLYDAWAVRRQNMELERQLAAAQVQAAEEARNVRHARQTAKRHNQVTRAHRQRQVQALEATRTKHKATAAAARRATADATMETQVSFQAYTYICGCWRHVCAGRWCGCWIYMHMRSPK